MTLDDLDVHWPKCKWCWKCGWDVGKEPCPETEDGEHEFVWEGIE